MKQKARNQYRHCRSEEPMQDEVNVEIPSEDEIYEKK